MELKEYQSAALDAFSRWLIALNAARVESIDTITDLQSKGRRIPDAIRDYPNEAWETLRQSGGVANPNAPYITRTDGANRPIPHICFKVPTGGGKTLLAASALERLNRQTGLTLWIIPTRAIYETNQSRPLQPRTPLPPSPRARQRRPRQNAPKRRPVHRRRHRQLPLRYAAYAARRQPPKRQRLPADVPRLRPLSHPIPRLRRRPSRRAKC